MWNISCTALYTNLQTQSRSFDVEPCGPGPECGPTADWTFEYGYLRKQEQAVENEMGGGEAETTAVNNPRVLVEWSAAHSRINGDDVR